MNRKKKADSEDRPNYIKLGFWALIATLMFLMLYEVLGNLGEYAS